MFVVHMCVFSCSDIFDLSYVCFCCVFAHANGYFSINESRYELILRVSVCLCDRCVFPAGPQCSERVQCRGLCLRIKLLLWVPTCTSLGRTVRVRNFRFGEEEMQKTDGDIYSFKVSKSKGESLQ